MACGAAIGVGVVSSLRDQRMPTARADSRIGRLDLAAARSTEVDLEPMPERRHGTSRDAHRIADAGHLTVLSNGNVVVPSDLAERIRIRAMDTEGNIDAEELSLVGIGAEGATKLQEALDGLKKWGIERESRLAQVIRKNHAEVLIRIPGDGIDHLKKKEFDDSIDTIFGQSRPFVEGALSHLGGLTSNWGAADLVVTARLVSDGYTEYKLFGYDSSRPPSLKEEDDPSVGAHSIRSFRAKEIPERLRHLFD